MHFAKTNNCQKRIGREKIDNLNIKKQFNTDEEWTRALKLMLIDMKYLLAWVANFRVVTTSSNSEGNVSQSRKK